ncbi:SAM-dependent methyltransferase [Kitasatospora sp. NPDC059817]|uniref:SAM-dependent methyltransferase n=1 Tax=Kitasatospora sp. NPDC059817 TaxID=3346961 RepID=UPI00364C0C10
MVALEPDAEIVSPVTYDPAVPSVARMYDLLLGGHAHFQSDRDGVRDLLKVAPSSVEVAAINRAFLVRTVQTLVRDYGVRQFIDHGSGLPTQRNVHQIAQEIDDSCRVVYIDNDPMVVHTGRTLLAGNPNTAVVHADMRDTDKIFSSKAVQDLILPHVPTAALFVSVLHCIPEKGSVPPARLVRQVRERLPADAPAYMAISQLVSPHLDVRRRITDLMADLTQHHWGEVRTEEDVVGYFEGMEILDPGVVEVSQWRPDPAAARTAQTSDEWTEFGGVARVH